MTKVTMGPKGLKATRENMGIYSKSGVILKEIMYVYAKMAQPYLCNLWAWMLCM